MFWILWLAGSLINLLIVSSPLWFVAGGTALFLDARFLSILATLTLWIGCDHSIPPKPIAHYREIRVHHQGTFWFPQVCGALVLMNIWVGVWDRALHLTGPTGAMPIGVGVLLAIFGLWLRFSAIRSLGRFFTDQLKVLTFQPLVVTGPYRRIRHPSYSAIVVILFGIDITLASIWGVIYTLTVIVPMVLLRVAFEERMLVEGFGAAYSEYQTHTRQLIPFVY